MPKKLPKKTARRKNVQTEHTKPTMGRPPKVYRPEYCADLIDHLRNGYSFDSFGAHLYQKYGPDALCGKNVLYDWVNLYPDFANAKLDGESLALKMYEDMGKAGASGQLRRVKTEVFDGDGKVTRREYDAATMNSTAYRLIMMNRFGYRENKNLEHTGAGGGPIQKKVTTSAAPLKEQIKDLQDDLETLKLIADQEAKLTKGNT